MAVNEWENDNSDNSDNYKQCRAQSKSNSSFVPKL